MKEGSLNSSDVDVLCFGASRTDAECNLVFTREVGTCLLVND